MPEVLVFFHLPEHEGLPYCKLSDLALSPARGSTYEFGGKLFEVERVVEMLSRKPDGTRKLVSEVLFSLVAAIDGELGGLQYIGPITDDAPVKPNGPKSSVLIIPSEMAVDADHFRKADSIVVLKMRLYKVLNIGDVAQQLRRAISAHADGTSESGIAQLVAALNAEATE